MFYSILAPPPYDIQIENGQNCASVIVAIARGADENRIVSVVSELAHAPEICGDAGCWEFSFSVDVIALDDSIEPFRTQDRNLAAPYIPAEIRGSVMDVVCKSFIALFGQVSPKLLYWVAKDRDLPEKALRKYEMLMEAAQDGGYLPHGAGTDPFGRRFWICAGVAIDRPPASSVR